MNPRLPPCVRTLVEERQRHAHKFSLGRESFSAALPRLPLFSTSKLPRADSRSPGWQHFRQSRQLLESRLACATFVACEILPIRFPDTLVMRRRLGRGFIPSFAVSPAAG